MKPILFNTEMVRAILEDRKTQTRRAIRPTYKDDEYGFQVCTNKATGERWLEKADVEGGSFDSPRYVLPKYQLGDVLYVRETWRMYEKAVGKGESFRVKRFYAYKADEGNQNVKKCSEWYDNIKPITLGYIENQKSGSWRPSIFMPKEAARLFLRVKSVRVERAHDITEEDAFCEGMTQQLATQLGLSVSESEEAFNLLDCRRTFQTLWDSLNKKRGFGWESNPWVWVYEFDRISKEDAISSTGQELPRVSP